MTDGKYSIIEIPVPPDHGPPIHIHHREDEGFYVIEGEFSYRYGDSMVPGSKGSYTYLKKGIAHTFKNEGKSTGKLLSIITPPGFERFFQELRVPITDPSSHTAPSAPPDLNRLIEVAKKYEWEVLSPPSCL